MNAVKGTGGWISGLPPAQKCITDHLVRRVHAVLPWNMTEVRHRPEQRGPPERTLSEWKVPENYDRGSRSMTVPYRDALSRQN